MQGALYAPRIFAALTGITESLEPKMPDHTVKAFDADIANLARMIAEMHERVEKGLKDAVEALIRNDDQLVKAVRAGQGLAHRYSGSQP